MGLIIHIIVGIVAGFLAGKIMKGSGFGILMNLVVGIIGGVLGGWVFGLLGLHFDSTIGGLITAVAGACLLLWIVSLFKKK
jgi:uncharacterized membrane protein YeaQ/YmgE (transglycosylase-associated protein family)